MNAPKNIESDTIYVTFLIIHYRQYNGRLALVIFSVKYGTTFAFN